MNILRNPVGSVPGSCSGLELFYIDGGLQPETVGKACPAWARLAHGFMMSCGQRPHSDHSATMFLLGKEEHIVIH